MADTEQLVLSISADVRQMQRALDRMTKDTAVTTRKIEGHFDRMGKKVNKSLGAIGAFARGGLAGIGAGLGINEIKNLLDASTRITNSLKVAGLEGAKLNEVYEQLFSTAQKFSVPLEGLVTLFSKLTLSQKELGMTTEQVADFTEHFAVAAKVGAVGAAQLDSAMLQLSQALSSGVVRGDEFNALAESMPTILQQAAAGIQQAEGSVSKLRDMMLEGKLSSKLFADGITAGASVMEQKLEGSATTIDQAFTQVANALLKSTSGFNDASGAGENFANFLIDSVVPAVDAVGTALINLNTAMDGFLTDWNAFQASGALQGEEWGLPDFGKMLKGTALGNMIEQMGGTLGRGAMIHGAGGVATGGRGGRVGTGAFGMGQNQGLPYSFAQGMPTTVAQGAVDATAAKYAVTGGAADKAAKSAADKMAKESDRAAEAFAESIGRQAEVAVDASMQLLDQSENTKAGRANINAFLKAGGVNLDAATTAWCAAFVNSALAQVGVTGTGSNVATDFLKFGKAVAPGDIQRGDIAVQPRGRGPGQQGGHVGFATGLVRFREGVQEIEVLSGNLKDKVSKDWVAVTEIVARRATEGFAIAADGLSHLTENTVELTDAQRALAETMANVADAAASSIGSFIQDLVDGKDASEALKNSLGQLADDLINIGLQGLTGSAGSGTGIAGIIASLIGGSLGATTLHRGGIAGLHGTPRTVPALAFAGAARYHSGGMAGIKPGEIPAILQRGEMVLPRGARMGGSSVVVNNYSKAEVQAREQPGGKGFEVIIEERIADRINTRGTPANKAVRSAASNQLRKL